MSLSSIKLKLFKTDAPHLVPARGTSGSAGLDLKAAIHNKTFVLPRGHTLIPTGIGVEIPRGYVGKICPRSGLALKYAITVLNSPGIIDSDFRGEIQVILYNASKEPFLVEPGDRIAQLLIQPVELDFTIEEVEELTPTERGTNGLGSTGVKDLTTKTWTTGSGT